MHGSAWQMEGLRIEAVHVPAGTRLREHGHEHPHLCYVEAGAFAEREGTGWRDVPGGTLRTSPAGDEHDIRFETETRCVLVIFEGAPLAATPRPVRDRFYSEGPAVRQVGEALGRALSSSSPTAFEIGTVALELLAAADARSPRRTTSRWLERVYDRLLDDPTLPPTTTELADLTGLHPVYVARAFRSRFGLGLGEFARIARAERARVLIGSSDTPLARLAVRAGYADQSHMTRELGRVFGATPGRLRAARSTHVEIAGLQDL